MKHQPRATRRATGGGGIGPKSAADQALPLVPSDYRQPDGCVLGLDPGSVRTGWGVVRRHGGGLQAVAAGVVRVPERAPIERRLVEIHRGLAEVIAHYQPGVAAIEDIFFARYPQAALTLGHARGVALLAVAQAGIAVHAYPPAVVKRAIVGSGRADKRQIALLVSAVLGLREPLAVDATDALAVAVTHLNTLRFKM